MQKVEIGNLIYSINKEDKTANIIGNTIVLLSIKEIIIPCSISINSEEYIVTRISRCAFEKSSTINSIKFADNSKIQAIDELAFCFSTVTSITIPPSLIELNEGWCSSTQSLTCINVMENNPRYLKYDDKFIIGKTSIEQDNYDVLVFCNRDVEIAKIPNFIEIIGSYAFNECFKLQKVEIQNDSKLRIIGKHAFSFASIENISIPHHVTYIGEDAFYSCYQLQRVEIPTNSELRIIDKEAFKCTSIESIRIPSNVIELKESWCGMTNKLCNIEIMGNNKRYSLYDNKYIIEKSSIDKKNFDRLIFSIQNVKIVTIPDFIEIIGPRTFYGYMNIHRVNISNNSKLKIIEKYAFCCTLIKRITIPPHLTHINEFAFASCFELQIVDIPSNSKLQVIGEKAFFNSSIFSISIPKNVVRIDEYAFYSCKKLGIFEIDENSMIEYLYQNIFLECDKIVVMIPTRLRKKLVKNK